MQQEICIATRAKDPDFSVPPHEHVARWLSALVKPVLTWIPLIPYCRPILKIRVSASRASWALHNGPLLQNFPTCSPLKIFQHIHSPEPVLTWILLVPYYPILKIRVSPSRASWALHNGWRGQNFPTYSPPKIFQHIHSPEPVFNMDSFGSLLSNFENQGIGKSG